MSCLCCRELNCFPKKKASIKKNIPVMGYHVVKAKEEETLVFFTSSQNVQKLHHFLFFYWCFNYFFSQSPPNIPQTDLQPKHFSSIIFFSIRKWWLRVVLGVPVSPVNSRMWSPPMREAWQTWSSCPCSFSRDAASPAKTPLKSSLSQEQVNTPRDPLAVPIS